MLIEKYKKITLVFTDDVPWNRDITAGYVPPTNMPWIEFNPS